jgi:hypothetical protein
MDDDAAFGGMAEEEEEPWSGGGEGGSGPAGAGAAAAGSSSFTVPISSGDFDGGPDGAVVRMMHEEHREKWLWYLTGSADLLVALLTMTGSVSEDKFNFSVSTTRVDGKLVSGLHINTLLRNNTLFVSAQLPCVVVFNNPDKCGSERVSVGLSSLMETIKQKGGSGSMVLYQVHPSISTELFVVSKDGTILRRGKIPRQENKSDSNTLPRMDMEYRLSIPVEMLRRELAYVNGVAKQDTKKVTLRVFSMPSDHLLLQIEAVGVGGAKATTTIHLARAGDIADDYVKHSFEQSNDPLLAETAVAEAGTMVFEDEYYCAVLLSILLSMRGETDVDVLVAPATPLLLRVQLGERPGAGQSNTSYVAFILAAATSA